MDHSSILIDIQKELLQILLTDHTLKGRFLDIHPKNSNVGENNFVGYVINKKTRMEHDLGFPLKKLEKWAYETKLYSNILSDVKPHFVSSYEYIIKKDLVLVNLQKNCIMEVFYKPIWGWNLKYGIESQNESNEFETVLQCHLNSPNDNIVNFRALLYAFFLKRFLSYSQKSESCILCNIRSLDGDQGSSRVLSLEHISCIENELSLKNIITSMSINQQFENCLQLIDDLKNRIPESLMEVSECLQIDGKLLVEKYISYKAYFKDIGFIKILDQGKATCHIKDVAVLNNLLKGKVIDVVHIVSSQRLYHVQRSALLLHASSDMIQQKFCVFTEYPLSLMDNFLKTRIEELYVSYQSKYGNAITGTQWTETIKQVAVSSLVLDIFSLSLNNQLKIISGDDVSCLSSRKSLFILYNYARLHNLQEQFEDKVRQGVYQALPCIESVSFSLLTEELEWKLILQYILMYPSLLYNIYSCICRAQVGSINLPTNQLCKFLCDLCHDFSSYYHQTKVLLDPQPHLSQLISARIYLILMLKDIMNHSFMLLGIVPPKQM